MSPASLKSIAYKKLEIAGILKSIENFSNCPFHVAKRLLEQLSPTQLLKIEKNDPTILEEAQAIWKLHTLKSFPNAGVQHDIFGDDTDWRAIYQKMHQDRMESEKIAREKLRARYSQIAAGKNDRKIQVTNLKAPSRVKKSSQPIMTASPVMRKIYKAAENSSTRSQKSIRASQAPLTTQTTSRQGICSNLVAAMSNQPPQSQVAALPNKRFFATM